MSEYFEEANVDESTDAVILALGEAIQAQESKTAIINPQRIAQMKLCYELISKLLMSPGVTISYHLHEPFKSMGSIILEADNFTVRKPAVFLLAVCLAANVEFYPLVNGRVRVAFAFDGLTRAIE